MYLWKISYMSFGTSAETSKARYVITSRNHLEDAIHRAKQIMSESEATHDYELLGYLPSIGETTSSFRPYAHYVLLSYLFPFEPEAAENTRRVLLDCYSLIDSTMAESIGITDSIGAIATNPGEALDIGKMGLIVGLASSDVEQAKEVIRTHIFKGEVPYENINIMKIKLAPVYYSQ